jgi:ribosome-associated protein YbcJ (S4-like RNA binding protein)
VNLKTLLSFFDFYFFLALYNILKEIKIFSKGGKAMAKAVLNI